MALESHTYRILRPALAYAEIDTLDLWNALTASLRNLFAHSDVGAANVAGIGISCLCPGLTAFDKDRNILFNPIIYSDQRSTAEAEFIKEVVGVDTLFEITANTAMAGAISGTSMLWIKRNRPDIYEKTRYFGHVNTLVAARLTGEFAMDHSNASYTALFETTGGLKWSKDLCELIGVDFEKLPPLKKSEEVVGYLNDPEFIALGIPSSTPVVIGGGDTACASLAVGITEHGDVCESVGTTNVLTTCVDKPRFNRAFINRCHVVSETWIYQGALSHTGSSLAWFGERFCQDLIQRARNGEHDSNVFGLMDDEAAGSLPGAGGVTFLPYMQGERSPVWDSHARGVLFGLSLQSSRADIIRAILEGCGYGLRQLTGVAEDMMGIRIPGFISIGGGSKSEVWTQIKADIMGKHIDILDIGNVAPMGAALLAGVGCGVFSSVKEASRRVEKKVLKRIIGRDTHKKVYDSHFEVYTKLYPQLRELYRVGLEVGP